MTRTRRFTAAAIAAATFAGALTATTTPASAWCDAYGCYGPDAGAVAAGALAAGALGAIAGAAAGAAGVAPGYRTCMTRQPVYDDWGRFAGYRRVAVAC